MPNPTTAGQRVAFSVNATDANLDPLSITWNFGDGTAAGRGTTVSHTYAAAGRYTVVATVSDGVLQTQSTAVVTVSSNGSGSGGDGGSATKALTVAGFAASFRLIFPAGCVQKRTPFRVSLSATRHRHAKGKVLKKVTKVVFALAGGPSVSDRSAPFSAQLTLGPNATLGSTLKLRATAFLILRGGRHRSKRLSASLKTC